MNKLLLISLLVFSLSTSVGAWDKSKFDLATVGATNSLSKTAGIGYEGQQLIKPIGEITLIQGGYFTLGINGGLSTSSLDDHCGITYGHPYALTSYPIVAIDGTWGKIDTFFQILESSPQRQNDSLKLSYMLPNWWQFNFTLSSDAIGQKVTARIELRNLDSQPHNFGLGLVFDAGLGRRGDGCMKLGNQDVERDTLLTGNPIPTQWELKERKGKWEGLKLSLATGNSRPDWLIIANWKDIYQDHQPHFSPSNLRKLYDLALKMVWEEQSVPAGAVIAKTISFELQPPDFGSSLFMRWDVPAFLSLENNLLFPRAFDSFVEIANLTGNNQNNVQLKFQFAQELSSSSSNYLLTVPAKSSTYQKVPLQSREILEDNIVDLSVMLEQNGQVMDQLTQPVYVPAILLSDTGLVCTIDSVITAAFPRIQFIFEAEVQATRQKLLNLAPENLFLYENETRIKTFTLGRDTTGGANSADIVFVLDVTGSMGDEINKVKNNIMEFTDSLTARGIDYRLGLVTFLDVIENVYEFTNNPTVFKYNVGQQTAHGGGDRPENSLDALFRATQYPFRDSAKRIFIWITDADYHEKDSVTPRSRQEVIQELLLNDVVVHAIGAQEFQTNWYNPIIEPTGGVYYNINGNFRDIMLDISRLKDFSKYLVTYSSPGAVQGSNQIKLEIHYAGLGGFGYAQYQRPGAGKLLVKTLSCYPNPFNPVIRIFVDLEEEAHGAIDIYNILGQCIRTFDLKSPSIRHVVEWDARDQFDQEVSAGAYFLRLRITDKRGRFVQNKTTKIIYMK